MRITLIFLLQICFFRVSLGGQLLPEVPRVGLHTLYEQSRNGRRGEIPDKIISEGERFLVVGTVVRAPAGQSGERWFLVGGIRACCNMLQVGLPLRGKGDFKEGQWIAIHGYLQREGPEWTLANLAWQGQLVFLGGDDLGIMAEEILPAEKIIHTNNIMDSISGDSVNDFQKILKLSGLENELRAADAITILIPHNRAIQQMDRHLPVEQQDLQAMRHWLLGHMLEGRWTTRKLLDAHEITMMNGDSQQITVENGSVKLGGCRILMKNIAGQNGVAHILMPVLPVSTFAEKAVTGEGRAFSSDPLDL